MVDFDLRCARGSFQLEMAATFSTSWTVLFGPSGSGKTTLLRLLAGLDTPLNESRGAEHARVSLSGRLLTDSRTGLHLAPGSGRKTGFVTQQPALFPHMSVAKNVEYGMPFMGKRERGEHVASLLDLVGGGSLLGKAVSQLSGGEAQRVALARALAPRPRLLLLDEPFSALDGAASDALLDRLVGWLKEHNIQTVLATHDAADAFAISAEVALLREGRLVALGPASAVLAAERERLARRLDPL